MNVSRLTTRLNAVRATIRRRLILYGVCSVLAGGAAAFLTIVTVDWLLWLPGMLRIFVAGLFLVGMVGATIHWIVRPARAPLSPLEIAGRLERYFGNLQDRLTSTVDFLQEDQQGSPSLMRQVVRNTDQLLAELPFDAALTLRPLVQRVAFFVLAAATLALVLAASPGWLGTGLYRYIHPFGEIEWPRRVEIVPLTGTQLVAMGESVTVRMGVARGLHSTLRPVVHLREPDGARLSLAMQRADAKDVFYATIDAVTSDLTCWFEAGDDSTERSPFTIRAVRRPEVMEALATIEPPPYAAGRPTRTQDLSNKPVNAPIGGFVTVRVRASKPIPPDPTASQLGLRQESGGLVPFEPVAGTRDELTARFEVRGDMRFRVALRDRQGFENRGARQCTVLAIPDAAPTVTIVQPRSLVELTPRGSVDLVIRAEDDFGITALNLRIDRPGNARPQVTSLTDRLVSTESGESAAFLVEYVWRVDRLSLNPGDVLAYWATATDNRLLDGHTGQIGQSARQRIKIISDIEFDTRIRDELALIERRLQEVALDEASLHDQTETLAGHDDEDADGPGALRDQAATLSGRQARLVRRVRDLAGRLARLGQRMARNQTGAGEPRRRVAEMDESLRQVAGGPMSVARAALSAAAERIRAEPSKDLLQRALSAEEEAVDRLNAMLRTMSRWGSFQELVTRTRDLVRRQDAVRTETIALGKTMLGKAVDSLTPPETAALKRTQRRQEQLATDVAEMIENMGRLRLDAAQKDGAGAESIDAALRTARARDLIKRQRRARDAIAVNRTAAAGLDQKAAAEALRAMVLALLDRERRELALLKIRLQRAEDQVAHLIEAQEALRAVAREAALLNIADESLNALAQEQHVLSVNTRLLGEELGEVPRVAGIARMVRSAAEPMARAEQRLRNRDAEQALSGQDEALELLRLARAGLEKTARRMADNALRQSLVQIRQGLEAVRSAQTRVNGKLDTLRIRIAARGRIARREARDASKLAHQQSAVLQGLNGMRSAFRRVPVYEWALRRVAQWMGTSRSWMASRKIDEELTSTTGRIVRELDKLIDAIREAEAMPAEDEFAEAEGGGGGEGRSDTAASLPTVTELLVLRSMQSDINERTKELNASVDWKRATEKQLRDLKIVGEDQESVRRLTELVNQRTR